MIVTVSRKTADLIHMKPYYHIAKIHTQDLNRVQEDRAHTLQNTSFITVLFSYLRSAPPNGGFLLPV
jgi:hypothetical protein